MHSTKTEILARLKRADSASVDELSSALGLASMTVRQHLTALERDALVRAEEVRRPTGRPQYRYLLTDEGHRSIADGYDRLVGLLVEQVGEMDACSFDDAAPDLRRRALFRRAAEALAARHRDAVQRLSGDARAEAIVGVLRDHGGFAEWHRHDNGIEIRDFSCVFRSTMGEAGMCEWHKPFLETLVDGAVRIAPPPGTGCAECCGYIISATPAEEPAAHAANGGSG
jgi:predicted ArsR family transcriptional regulator